MKEYYSPKILSYNSHALLEHNGPIQTAYVNVTIGATAFNTNSPAIYKNVNISEYRLVKTITNHKNTTGVA